MRQDASIGLAVAAMLGAVVLLIIVGWLSDDPDIFAACVVTGLVFAVVALIIAVVVFVIARSSDTETAPKAPARAPTGPFALETFPESHRIRVKSTRLSMAGLACFATCCALSFTDFAELLTSANSSYRAFFHVMLWVFLGSTGLLAVLSVLLVKRTEEFRVRGEILCWKRTGLFGMRRRQRPLQELRVVRVGSILHGVICEWASGSAWRTHLGGARTDVAVRIAATLQEWRGEYTSPTSTRNRQDS